MSEELTRSGEGLFGPARRGYDREEVDTYVAQLQRQIRELQTAPAPTPDEAVREALERVGEEVSGVLKQAHASAEELVRIAQREAKQHREEAARDAAHITSVAEQRVHELDLDTDRIWGERERIVADARDLARQLNQLADLAAERFPQDQQQQAKVSTGVADQEEGLDYGDESVSGFDELNASH
jgi:cell division septum initiation protein DivIVA